MSDYCYQHLDNSQKEIRLMLLSPPQDKQEPITVTLKTVSLSNPELGPFAALSYTWGTPDDTSKVLVNETGEFIRVTPNLVEALVALRSDRDTQDAWMWIDAICVNQRDLEERSLQVLHFATIYSKAAKVIAWIGSQDADSERALNCLEEISHHVSFDFSSREFHAKTADLGWAVNRESSIDDLQSVSLMHFFDRSWFTRLWVRQEIVFGANRAVIKCGSRTISWPSLRSAIAYIDRKGHPSRAFESWGMGETCTYLYYLSDANLRSKYKDLSRLLDKGRATRCTDDRDRVYALLSSLTEEAGSFCRACIVPDYSKSLREVYTEAALVHMDYCGSMQIIALVAAPNDKRSGDSLPSWVPDWSTSRETSEICGQAGMRVVYAPFPCTDGTLHARGKIVAKIERVSPWPDHKGPCKATIQLCMQQMVFDSVIDDIQAGNASVLCQLSRVLCMNEFSDRYAARGSSKGLPTFTGAGEAILETFGAPGDHEALGQDMLRPVEATTDRPRNQCLSEQDRHWFAWKAIYHTCRRRQLVIGNDGRLGLVPAHARVGDVIAVFPGCDAATTLRSTAEDRFSVVGPAFYDGYMDGEAFLGMLPSSHECLGSSWPVYRNLMTGELQHDPRISDRFIGATSSKEIVKGTLWKTAIYDFEAMESEGLVQLDAIKLV